jgi:hypothetical protein
MPARLIGSHKAGGGNSELRTTFAPTGLTSVLSSEFRVPYSALDLPEPSQTYNFGTAGVDKLR